MLFAIILLQDTVVNVAEHASSDNNQLAVWIGIALSAVSSLLAVTALIYNINHQKLSVRPRLQFHIQTTFTITEDKIGCFLRNKGLGPADVTNILFKKNKSSYSEDDLLKYLNSFPNYAVYNIPEVGDYIKVNDEFELITLSTKDLDDEVVTRKKDSSYKKIEDVSDDHIKSCILTEFIDLITGIEIVVQFRSLYEEKSLLKRGKSVSKVISGFKKPDLKGDCPEKIT